MSDVALVIGAGGLLGSAMVDALKARGAQVATLSRAHIDLEHLDQVEAVLARHKPARVFNCAAHTDLEAAEIAPQLDRLVNKDLAEAVAKACAKVNVPLVHFSSTGCYGDWKSEPYVESDELRPLSQHHKAKLAGERAVIQAGGPSLIFRLGWLYGGDTSQPKNFVWKRLVEAVGTAEMVSDSTQRGCPSHVEDVAQQVLLAVEQGLLGVYNAVSRGSASRYEYVDAIVSASGLPCKVSPGPGFRRNAPVSPNEMAINDGLSKAGLDRMPEWRESLVKFVTSLMQSSALDR